MGWTKRDVVRQAFAELGRGDYDFDLQPDEMQNALRVLDMMVARWGSAGLRIGYSGGDGSGEIDAGAAVPEFAIEALYTGLALRLAPSFGKTVAAETARAAQEAYSDLAARMIRVRPRTVVGYAGGFSALSPSPDGITLGRDGNTMIGEA